MGGIGMIMLNRLPQDLAGHERSSASSSAWPRRSCSGSASGWSRCSRSRSACATTAILRHYKYTWAAIGIVLLAATLVFGYEVNGARLWIDLGPVSVQPGEFLKIVLVIFIAGYLAETRTLLTSARLRIGFLSIPPLPYFLPMLALFARGDADRRPPQRPRAPRSSSSAPS